MEPVAQTFRIENSNGGCFITSIDIFFKTKSASHPVTIELVTLNGGVPSNLVLADKIMYPANINVSSNASLATKFTFNTPVFVDDGDYAFILKTNSTDYQVWVATVGQAAVDSPTAIWKQAADGQMMSSQNKQSWDEVEGSDIKYIIRKAKFNTAVTGSVVFRNKSPEVKTRSGDLIETTNSSTTLKIYIQHHGMTAGVSKVRLEFDNTAEDFDGILASNLDGNTYTVTGAGWNYITITAPDTATGSGVHYTSGIAVTFDAPMDRIAVTGMTQTHIGTAAQAKIKTTSGRSISGSQTPYVKDTGWSNLELETIHYFKTPRLVASYPNELLNMSDANSLEVAVDLSTTNENLSPIVHIDKFGASVVGRVMNDDLTNETNPTGGNALAKYVTKAVQLQDPATSLRIMLAANVADGNMISVYYKLKSPKVSGNIDGESWTKLEPTTPIVTSSNYEEFFDYTFEDNKLTQFTSFRIKVVFTGTNTASSPRIKDFRFIALAV